MARWRTVVGEQDRQRVRVDDWHVPVLAGAWATSIFNATPAGYWLDPWGVVHLRGTLDTGAIGSAVFTLPDGYRPQVNTWLPAVAYVFLGAPLAVVVEVSTAGVVKEFVGRLAAANALLLDGLTFRTAV